MGNDSSSSCFAAIRVGLKSDSASAVVHANHACLDTFSFLVGKLGKFLVAELQLPFPESHHGNYDSTFSHYGDKDGTIDLN